jgi:hypothetical protein
MPRTIMDDELIVRSIRKGWIKKGELLYSAFRPPAEVTVVSVLSGLMGDDFCKAKSREICKADYVGMASIKALDIRVLEADVVDAPEDFEGHLHIDHIDPPAPSSNPLAPELNKALNDRCKALAKKARLCLDPDPINEKWTGQPLAEPSY